MSVDDSARWRRAVSDFDGQQDISDEEVSEILAVAQRAPSSFNFEPLRVVVVRSAESRAALAGCMVAKNADRVKQASVSLVVLSDMEAMRDAAGVVSRARKSGMPDHLADTLATKAALFAGGALGKAGDALRLGSVAVASAIAGGSGIPLPTPQPAEAWATKQAGIYCGFLLLAAASRRIDTSPMEGFDAGHIRRALNIPPRFSVTVVISMGRNSTSGTADPVELDASRTGRRPLSETVFRDRFDATCGWEAEPADDDRS